MVKNVLFTNMPKMLKDFTFRKEKKIFHEKYPTKLRVITAKKQLISPVIKISQKNVSNIINYKFIII